MATYALTGNDDLIINDRPITEFTDNSTIQITFPNEKVGISTGKNAMKPYSIKKSATLSCTSFNSIPRFSINSRFK